VGRYERRRRGLWYAMGSEYDVIILDLMLPGVPGLEILKKIRAADNKAHVLILTAKDTIEDRVAGLDLGADRLSRQALRV